MTRLIDADELKEYVGRESLDTREKIFALVDRMPTLPNPCGKPCAFERPRGTWIEKYQWKFKYYCSFCGSGADRKGRFCDTCGADMRKNGEANEM